MTEALANAGKAWAEARRAERVAAEAATKEIRAAYESGLTEVEIAAVVGVNRTTVRRALGK